MFKYAHERTNKNNESTTMRDKPATGVLFYQRATPIDGSPVAGENGITENMINFWKCGRRDHRYPFCPKGDDEGFQVMQYLLTQGMHPPFSGQFTHSSWMLIDTRSTLNSIFNHQLLRRVRTCSKIQSL